MLKQWLYHILFYFIILNTSQAQNSTIHEAGFLVGPSLVLSDYGQRSNLNSKINNTGLSLGLVHCLTVQDKYPNTTYVKVHFKIRSELSYTKAVLNHYSDWIENNPNSEDARQLKAMETKSSVFNLGSQLEYYPLEEIYNIKVKPKKFSPYASLGFLFSFYDPKTYSSLGELGTNEATFAKYLVPSDGRKYGFTNEKGSTWSIVSGIGTRYKLSDKGSLIVEIRLQWFNSDWIDGLNISKEQFTENRYNDTVFWFNFGYVFRL